MGSQEIIFHKEGGVATITLNRPEVRNALSPDMLEDFAALLDSCMDKDVRAVVIAGSGGAFCSGADVRNFTQVLDKGPQELSAHLEQVAGLLHRSVVLKIRHLPKPVIASVGGVAAGAGFSLALACDVRVASDNARFFLAYANIGATADGGSTYYLPRLLGSARAMEVYLAKQPINAQEALEMGLVNRVVSADEIESHTLEMARSLASGPTVAYGKVKALMDRSWTSDIASQLDAETRAISDIALTEDFQEGITAFVEKRAPRFQGV